jgi:catechol 2,3-dioxygenase-like lactoylglutathione lyase family enzyme
MELGAFSISLSVADIHKSFDFYTKLGFKQIGGEIDQNWLILKNGDHIIGLFEGMFEKNSLTFNPGWNQDAESSDPFTDIRQIKSNLESQGITVQGEIDSDSGPASIILEDPDGNPILIDQHR